MHSCPFIFKLVLKRFTIITFFPLVISYEIVLINKENQTVKKKFIAMLDWHKHRWIFWRILFFVFFFFSINKKRLIFLYPNICDANEKEEVRSIDTTYCETWLIMFWKSITRRIPRDKSTKRWQLIFAWYFMRCECKRVSWL